MQNGPPQTSNSRIGRTPKENFKNVIVNTKTADKYSSTVFHEKHTTYNTHLKITELTALLSPALGFRVAKTRR
jgi:hypothetical protein